MNPTTRLSRHTTLVLAAAFAATLAACDDLTEPNEHRLGEPAPELALDAAAAGGVPAGTFAVEQFILIADTVGVRDVFQREGADGYYSLAVAPTRGRYIFDPGVRIAGRDPRLPALDPLPDPGRFRTVFARLQGPEWFNLAIWDFFMRWDGLEPGKAYTFAIERLATRVNGILDALEFFLEGEVEQPDELVPLGGTPGGFPANDYTFTTNAGCAREPVPVPPPNPWYLGVFTASSAGRGTADFCMGTPWLWHRDTTTLKPDSSIVAVNELRTGVVPQYNYVVVYEGRAPDLGPPVIRIQMGVDIDLQGNPIPNGFAPFPVGVDRERAIELPNVGAAPRKVRFELRNLEPLAGGAPYEVWLLNAVSGRSIPAVGDYFTIETRVETDTLGQQFQVEVPSDTVRTASFQGVGAVSVRHAFVVANATIQPERLRAFTHIVVTRPGEQGAPTDPPLWVQHLDQAGTPDDPSDDSFLPTDNFRFGALDLADPASSRVYRISGSGDGAIWEGQLGIQFRRLSRPPPGYLYEVWLVDASGGATSLGPITTPAPEFASLADADAQLNLDVMTASQILRAAKYVRLSEAAIDLSVFKEVQLTLEPKAGVPTKGPTLILSGPLPEVLR